MGVEEDDDDDDDDDDDGNDDGDKLPSKFFLSLSSEVMRIY
jgi:hypothetical protein